MGEKNLYFNIGDVLKVDTEEYSVEGLIIFINEADSCKWTEYKLRQRQSNEIKWLSVDETYEEYAIYSECKYKSAFKEENIISEGYKEVDSGTARVLDSRGSVDVDYNEKVDFKEFEDCNEYNIISIEKWGFETEYSTGHYIECNQIEKILGGYNTGYQRENLANKYGNKKSISNIFSGNINRIVIFAVIAIFIIGIIFSNTKNKNEIADFLKSNSSFTYSTSITSDGEAQEKADVYSTSLSIEDAAKSIINKIDGDVCDVQENPEDLSVAILTDNEYCMVYPDEEGKVFVQVSTRLYAYSSEQQPYRSRASGARFFRSFYYSTGYTTDSSKYSSNRNSYSSYDGGTVNSNSSDKYKSYSSSARQSSARQSSSSSRTSSGGGTSSGK